MFKFFFGTKNEYLDLIDQTIASKRFMTNISFNAWVYVVLRQSPLFAQMDKCTCTIDGRVFYWGVKLRYGGASDLFRMSYFVYDIFDLLEKRGGSCYFIGSTPDVAEQVQKKLQHDYPHMRVACTSAWVWQDKAHGKLTNTIKDRLPEVQENIKQFSPDILFIGLGTPLQEEFLLNNWELISTHTHLAITCGALMDWISGHFVPVPPIINSLGLEWLWRLIHEPHRLWKRYVWGNLKALQLFTKDSLSTQKPPVFNFLTYKQLSERKEKG